MRPCYIVFRFVCCSLRRQQRFQSEDLLKREVRGETIISTSSMASIFGASRIIMKGQGRGDLLMRELKVETIMSISSMESISGVFRISMSLLEGFKFKQKNHLCPLFWCDGTIKILEAGYQESELNRVLCGYLWRHLSSTLLQWNRCRQMGRKDSKLNSFKGKEGGKICRMKP